MSTTLTPVPSNQASSPSSGQIYLIAFLLVIALLLLIAGGFTYRWYRIRKKRQRANALSRPLRTVRPSLWERFKLSGRNRRKDDEEDDTEEMDEPPPSGMATPFPFPPKDDVSPTSQDRFGHGTNVAARLPSGAKVPPPLPVTAQAPRAQTKKSRLPHA
ncbi:hypothetical protein VNI00_019423 [Paramarasmius palmivorus]|uniref:Uncharacterized protein n=1 Tax=Paramarasmius palmivorus TaxID=297713 RepID=A0AAW0ANI9_9AGAR